MKCSIWVRRATKDNEGFLQNIAIVEEVDMEIIDILIKNAAKKFDSISIDIETKKEK